MEMCTRNPSLLTAAALLAAPLGLTLLAGSGPRPAAAGDALPQLFPSWTNVRANCTGHGRKIRCRLKGKISVVNDGNAASGPCQLDIWVSRDDTLDPKVDTKIKTLGVPVVPAGEETKLDFSFSAPKGTKVLKRQLIAVVDPDNVVAESDETDNEEAIGPLR